MNNNLATQEDSKNPVVAVGKQISRFLSQGSLRLPPDYSPENALKSAWLLLQEIENKEHQKVLANGQVNTNVVTTESVMNCLLDMVVQGLNPAKKQCYMIVYGKTLTCQRSYFGDQMLAERVRPGIEVYANVVYAKDKFEMGFLRGRKVVSKHETKLENAISDQMIAAYCGIYDSATGEDLGVEVMTIEQIRKSWSKSKVYSPGRGTHAEFPEEMAKRTVIRKRCKPIVNASTDTLLLQAIARQDLDEAEGELQSEIAQHANRDLIKMPELAGQPTATRDVIADATTTGVRTNSEDVAEQEPRGAHNADAGNPDQTPAPEPQGPATGAAEPEAAEETQDQAKPATAPKKRLILSQQQTEEMTARLAKIPDAATPPMFKAACERDGLDWAGVQARLDEIEAGEAARQPF